MPQEFQEQEDLVVFDVCDTLYNANTTMGFLRDFHLRRGNRRYRLLEAALLSRKSPLFYLGAALHRWLHRDLVKERLIATLRGTSRAQLRDAAQRYVKDVLAGCRNESIHARLAAHMAAGHRIVLISSSLDVVVDAIAYELRVEGCGSTLEYSGDRCTGRLLEDLTGRKLDALAALQPKAGRLHVFTDNASDLTLVRRADVRTVVVPRGRSRAPWEGTDADFLHL